MKKIIQIIIFLFFTSPTFQLATAQTFLNGSFETTTAVGDQINLSNAAFNSMMSNTTAYGTYGDMDIITSGTYCSTAQNGAWFVAFTGGGSDAIAMELSVPLVSGNSYTISFWDRACCPTWTPQVFQIGLSTVNSAQGNIIYTGPLPTCNIWTNHTFTFTAPNNGLYITAQSGGTYSLSDWTQIDNFSFVSSSNSITTGVIAGSPFCACDAVNVPFTSTGTFIAGNVYTAQLSDAAGSFATPVSIGTLASTANSGTIACIIPCNSVAGTQYRIRVVSSTPAVIGSDNGIDITINTIVAPSVTISASPSGAVCAGDPVTFTAVAANGGTTPVYQWQVNGLNAGSNSATFTSSTLNNGDVVTVILISNAACVSPLADTSNAIVMTVNSTVVPSVVISAVPTGPICAGDPVTFTAVPANGGAAPVYQWQVNGVNAGTNSATFTSSSLNNGDIVTVILASSASCASPVTATSNAIVMTVNSVMVPSVVITALPPGPICIGDLVAFTAATTNGGTAPVYQWQVNGVNAGTNSSSFSSSSLVNGDVVTVILTSSASCASPPNDTSNAITMIVNSVVVPSVVIISIPSGPICIGDMVTFTATPNNGGISPTYQWQVNGVNAGANSPSFSPSSLHNGDVVTVILTSSASCASPASALSNAITMTFIPPPVVTISPDISIALGDSTTLTAGGGYTYVWSPSDGLSCINCQTTIASPSITTLYCVEVSDSAGCHSSACVEVAVELQCGAVYIPTAFSPNGDNMNDLLYVRGGCIESMNFIIFDRWGEQVFISTSTENGWDGTLRGKPLEAGVFCYYLKAKTLDDRTIRRKGSVTLVR